jgi:hypothetical protein
MSTGALISNKKKLLDVGKDLVPQLKEEVNDRRWPAPPAQRFKLTFLKIHKKITSRCRRRQKNQRQRPLKAF